MRTFWSHFTYPLGNSEHYRPPFLAEILFSFSFLLIFHQPGGCSALVPFSVSLSHPSLSSDTPGDSDVDSEMTPRLFRFHTSFLDHLRYAMVSVCDEDTQTSVGTFWPRAAWHLDITQAPQIRRVQNRTSWPPPTPRLCCCLNRQHDMLVSFWPIPFLNLCIHLPTFNLLFSVKEYAFWSPWPRSSPQIQPLPSIPTINGLGHTNPLTLRYHRTCKLIHSPQSTLPGYFPCCTQQANF